MGFFCSSKSRSRLSRSANNWTPESPSEYKEAIDSASPDGFSPTSQLQVQAIGYDVNQALTGKTLENITVYRVESGEAEYISIRLKKNSNSCALVRASDPSQTPLISTIYRFGPGRHPRMRILPDNAEVSVEEALNGGNVRGELVEVKPRSIVSRDQVFDTSLGKFEWRYGTAEEHAACDADSLLVMEGVDRVALQSYGRESKSGVPVARFIRNDRLRTPGSKRYSGGNGGRLLMDLRLWDDDKDVSARGVEAFVVASCILMLKKEADRFINNSIALVA